MAKKKTNGNKKKPKETGTWYKKLIEGQSKAEFYRHFLKKINDISTEYFGEVETKRTLKAIETKKIQIPGIESFLFDFNDVSDPSLELYNTCKSVEELVAKSVIFFKQKAERGESNILIKYFFLIMSDLAKDKILYPEHRIKEILKNFISSLITVVNENPYIISIIEPKWAKEVGKQLNLNTDRYHPLAITFLEVYQELMNYTISTRACYPKIKIVYPVYHDVRENQLAYLVNKFRMADRANLIKTICKDISDLSKDTPQLRSTLEYVRSRANLPFLCLEPIIMELQNLGESTYLKRYPNRNSLATVFNKKIMPKNYYNAFNIEPLFVQKETYEKCMVPYFCDVHINCKGLSTENIESFIDAAKIINLVKGYYTKTKRDIDTLTFKITLLNVQEVNEEFVQFIRNKLERIQSLTNKNFIIEVFYDANIVNNRLPEDLITHFRIISDIHADYNEGHNYHFNFGNDFIINCGDTAGNAVDAANWLNSYTKKGVFVIGNHLGYSSSHPERDGIQNMETYGNLRHPSNAKNEQVAELYNLTDKKDNPLLSNNLIEYNGIIIIGTCLYTDFNLYGENHREECMATAKKVMNDFRLPVISNYKYYTQDRHGVWWLNQRKKADSKIVTFDVSNHAFYFQFSFNFIKEKVEEYKHKPIIIVTHHAPSPYSIDEQYKGSLLNAAFASNLNQYIVEHPQIRLWAHGHVHNPCDYILGETRIVCCPFGYNNENNFNLPYEYGLRIPIGDIKSKKSWRKIFAKQILHGSMQCYDY